VRAKTVVTIACFSAFALWICAGAGLQAQTSPSPSEPAAATQDSANDLSVAVGKTVLVDTTWPIKRVAIGMSEIAEVHGTGPTEIMVNGKTPGETSLIVWDTHGGRQFFNVTVRASAAALNDSLDSIRRELRTELPGQPLKVTLENGSILLRGTVRDLDSSSRAVKIAGTGGKVVNLLDVNVPASDPQILLKVRFASVDRNKEKQMGINIFSLGALNTVGGISTGQYSPPTITGASGGSTTTTNGVTTVTPASAATATFTNEMNLLALSPGGLPFGVDIEALESKGVVQVLAEPNIVAMNGKQASFLAGGEYPYAFSSGLGTISVEFKEYGVRLNFLPTITPRGTVRLQVAPEVSSLDYTNAITISGYEIPAIATRKMKTEIELSNGQSFVIGGLLDNRDTEAYQKVPFLGDIPIIGKFFQSMSKNRTNTELIVLATLEMVAPIQAADPLPALKYPTKFLPPNSGIPMNTPDAKTAANTPASAPPTMPVERLMESMKPETPLMVQGETGNFGGSSSSVTSTTAAPTPPNQ
jgi:pilus assembly protein CpaC